MTQRIRPFFALMVLAVIYFAAHSVKADPIVINSNAFSGNATFLPFGSIPIDQEITNQFTGLGVTFSGGLFSLGGGLALNVRAAETCSNNVCNDVVVDFSSSIRRVGFDTMTNPPDDLRLITFRLVNGSYTQTGSFDFDTGFFFSIFVGVEDATNGIDRLVIDGIGGANGAFSVMNFRFEGTASPVPEPATMLLLGTGIAGIAAKACRRRRIA